MRIQLQDVGIISKCDLEFVPGINLIIGSSGSGKSTLMRCIYNVATNEFTDSDISFGKNTMNIRIEDDGNIIEYSRSIKAKGERCYYKVNNETYVKLGRQALPAVSEALKIGDIDINGDSINFNFNLQFSSPFLILGNQSTLYNVLTYRSTFDISSINDYYAVDIKNNASEIASNIKLKERLESSLESLEMQADKLSPIEKLYGDYVSYKHKAEIVEDLESLSDKTSQLSDVENNLIAINDVAKHVTNAEVIAEKLNNLISYNEVNRSYHNLVSTVAEYDERIKHYASALKLIELLIQFNKLHRSLKQQSAITGNIRILNKCLKGSTKFINDEAFICDTIKQKNTVTQFNKCDKIVEILNKCNDHSITQIDELMFVEKQLEALHRVNQSISEVENKQTLVNDKLSQFKVCPLCGVSLDGHERC